MARCRLANSEAAQRQQSHDLWFLRQHRVEVGVHDVDLVNPTFLSRTEELLDQRVRDLAGLSIGRRIGETTPHVLGLATTELEVLHSLATTQVGDDLLLRPESGVQLLGRLDRIRGIRSGETAIRGDQQHSRTLRGRIDGGERVLLVGVGGNRRQGSCQL